jgi:large subunit ribosomal protein L19e
MNLANKKILASKTLKVGKKRILFLDSRKEEIKEAITKQDIRDLLASGAILVKNVSGRKKVVGRKYPRKAGKIKQTVNVRKREYVVITRKLRAYLNSVRERLGLSSEEVKNARKKIRNRHFKSLSNFKEYLKGERN